MCIIIDTNKIHEFLNEPPSDDTRPIHDWVAKKSGSLIYTTYGQYGDELKTVQKRLLTYYRSGKATHIGKEKIISEEAKLQVANEHISDDVHILALARASGARLLYTGDKNLMTDFKTKSIIDNPRGKIYSNAKQKNLLKPGLCNRLS